MQLKVPDPEYTASPRAQANFMLAIKLTLGFLAIVWAVFLFEQISQISLSRFGLRPREGMGLLGLLTTPLLHGSLSHIGSNSLPLFVAGVAMLFLYPHASLRAWPMIYLGSAALAWVFARPSVHIGASGLVYGMLAFVFVSGILRRDLRSVGVSLMVWFFYGSMVWGVLPAGRGMSWELHLSGALVGVVLAYLYRDWDRPPVKRYDWEDDPEDGDEFGADDDFTKSERPAERDQDQDPWRSDRWH